MPKIANLFFLGLVVGTCIDHDHPQYGDCLQKCETDFSMCKSKCKGDSVCINACDDEQIACIGKTYRGPHVRSGKPGLELSNIQLKNFVCKFI